MQKIAEQQAGLASERSLLSSSSYLFYPRGVTSIAMTFPKKDSSSLSIHLPNISSSNLSLMIDARSERERESAFVHKTMWERIFAVLRMILCGKLLLLAQECAPLGVHCVHAGIMHLRVVCISTNLFPLLQHALAQ